MPEPGQPSPGQLTADKVYILILNLERVSNGMLGQANAVSRPIEAGRNAVHSVSNSLQSKFIYYRF